MRHAFPVIDNVLVVRQEAGDEGDSAQKYLQLADPRPAASGLVAQAVALRPEAEPDLLVCQADDSLGIRDAALEPDGRRCMESFPGEGSVRLEDETVSIFKDNVLDIIAWQILLDSGVTSLQPGGPDDLLVDAFDPGVELLSLDGRDDLLGHQRETGEKENEQGDGADNGFHIRSF